jgi:hypothetical protein
MRVWSDAGIQIPTENSLFHEAFDTGAAEEFTAFDFLLDTL